MSKLRLLSAVVAIFAVSAAVAAVAGAFEVLGQCSGTEHWQLCAETSAGVLSLIDGTVTFAGSKDEGVSELLVEAGPHILCTEANAVGTFNGVAGANVKAEKVKVDFHGCTVSNAELECEVVEVVMGMPRVGLIETTELEGTLNATEGPADVTFKPVTSEIFATFSVKSKSGQTCTFAITNGKVTGTQLCALEEPGSDKKEHLLHCNTLGTETATLKFGGKNARLDELLIAAHLTQGTLATAPWTIELDNG